MKNLLIKRLEELDKFNEFVGEINLKKTPINVSGLEFVSKSHIISSVQDTINRPICLITYNELQAKELVKDLSFFGEKIEYFGKKEIASYDYVSGSKDLPYTRIDVLNKIYNRNVKIIVTTIEAILQKIIPQKVLYKNVIKFTVGNVFECSNFSGKKNLNNLKNLLLLLGYERNDMVENRGQFSIRGGIVDIGISEKIGVRIEFWGDEVDSIRYFNISSQRTTEMADQVLILPAHEYLLEYNMEEGILPEYSSIVSNVTKRIENKYLDKNKLIFKDINDSKIIQNIKSDIEAIQNGEYISKIDKYFNEFYTESNTLLDYLPRNTLIAIDENLKINQRIENIIIENNNLIKSLTEKERFIPEAIYNISEFNKEEWNEIYNKKQTIYLYENSNDTVNRFEFRYRPINFYKSETEILIENIKKWIKEKKELIILAGSKENISKINNLLIENKIEGFSDNKIDEDNNNKIKIIPGRSFIRF